LVHIVAATVITLAESTSSIGSSIVIKELNIWVFKCTIIAIATENTMELVKNKLGIT